jgi:hypothetical protein
VTPSGNAVETIELPPKGVWRIGLATDPYQTPPPLSLDDLNDAAAGNRFDSPVGNYSVLYFGTELEVCFGETLARFRPDPRVVAEIEDDWDDQGFMRPGDVPADWRLRRLAVRAEASGGARFLDVEAPSTRRTLAVQLAAVLASYGALDLDVAAIRSGDRRVTRAISYWAWSRMNDDGDPVYAGIRYLSRLDTAWECWGIFDDVPLQELERRSITPSMSELQSVATSFGLQVF